VAYFFGPPCIRVLIMEIRFWRHPYIYKRRVLLPIDW